MDYVTVCTDSIAQICMFRSCCQQVHCQSRTDWALEFCNFCIEFCKKPSRKTFLMRVFAGLCTGKVTLSYLMLQNTGQNVQKIDASAQRPIGLKMGLAGKAAVSPERTAFAVFQIHFSQRMLLHGKSSL